MSIRSIAYCIDGNYPLPLSVSLRSVLEHWSAKEPLQVFILHSPLPAGSKEKVEASLPEGGHYELHWVAVDPSRISALQVGLHFSSANYFRLLLPELLPASTERVLYLDADTVAVANVAPLFALFDERFAIQACHDYTGTMGNPLVQLKSPERFGVKPSDPYFNSGVMLINLRLWRQDRIADQVIQFGLSHPDALFLVDQTAINIVLSGRIGLLPPEWNAQTVHPNVTNGVWHVPYLPQDHEQAKIVHYTSEWKPWGIGRHLPGARHFAEVFTRTAWVEP